jgi:hypothetical protein
VRDSVGVVRIQHGTRQTWAGACYERGGALRKKKHDPLWKIVNEKIALQGGEPDVDVTCPYCHVIVHLGSAVEDKDRYVCGLCGGLSEVVEGEAGELGLKPLE